MPRPKVLVPERVMVQVRMPRDLVRRIDHMAVDRDLYRAQMVEFLVRLALQSPKYATTAQGTGTTDG